MSNITTKSRIKLNWKVNPYDYSKEGENAILSKASKKYGIPKEKIRVIPQFLMLNEKGEQLSVANDIVENIQRPEFQLQLFQEYLEMNNIQNYDFELIKKIDAELNSKIDYDVYDKYRRYKINWIKWDNFLSYGQSNYMDFTQLKDLVLLNGEPANQSGKTTFAIDLLHFLLFGKTSKAKTQDKIFNKHIPEATEVVVEGSLTIENEEYIIKRRLTRPQLTKRTVKSKTLQKVEYYKVVGGSLQELEDYIDDMQAENAIQTNKIIKEAIGSEQDFDMILCATSANLDNLIDEKETERGRMLSKWIGLLPIEQKDILAREKFNSDIKPYLISSKYNSESLQQEIDAFTVNNRTLKKEIAKYVSENSSIEKLIEEKGETLKRLIESKTQIDQNLLRIDINTLSRQMEEIKLQGIKKSEEINVIKGDLETISDVQFSMMEYESLLTKNNAKTLEIASKRQEYALLKKTLTSLKESEYCPTCGRKYDNVDNTKKIEEINSQLQELATQGEELVKEQKLILDEIESMKTLMQQYEKKSQLSVKLSALELNVEQLRNSYKEKLTLLNEYNKNNDAIDRNNKLDIEIRNLEVNIRHQRNTKETNIRCIDNNERSIVLNTQCIDERKELIQKIQEETKLVRHWKIFLDMVGKNGISKMVLRKTLPIINAQIARLLNGVCDFDVEVAVTEKNEVMFFLIKDGIKSDLSSGSGFERTAASLALRSVLANISTLPKLNCFVVDEVLGRVAKENYDNMKSLYEKILENYDFIIQISHLDEIKDWHNTILTVKKDVNISKMVISK